MAQNGKLTMSEASNAPDRGERFVPLFAAAEREVFTFILTLLPRWADADEVLQRTSIILWRKFDEFAADTNFTAWACQIARLEVHNYRRGKGRERVLYSNELVDQLAETREQERSGQDDRRMALQACIEKLRPTDRELIRHCYLEKQANVVQTAEKLGRPLNTVYKALTRIRQSLYECIERVTSTEGQP